MSQIIRLLLSIAILVIASHSFASEGLPEDLGQSDSSPLLHDNSSPYSHVIGAHLGSIHWPKSTYCNGNFGPYGRIKVRSTGFWGQVGAYKNSHCTGWNRYVAAGWESSGEDFRVALGLGLAWGYAKDGSATVMPQASVSHPLIREHDIRWRLAGSPLIGNRVKEAGKKVGFLVHLMIEKEMNWL